MTQQEAGGLTFHERLYAIMRWERRCAQASLQEAARHGDRWLQEELTRVARGRLPSAALARPRGRSRLPAGWTRGGR
jgi:hypothetical protein